MKMKWTYMVGLVLMLVGTAFAANEDAATSTGVVGAVAIAVEEVPSVTSVAETGESTDGATNAAPTVASTEPSIVSPVVKEMGEAFAVVLSEKNIVVNVDYSSQWYEGNDGRMQIVYRVGSEPEIRMLGGIEYEIREPERIGAEGADERDYAVSTETAPTLVTTAAVEVHGMKVVEETAVNTVQVALPSANVAGAKAVEITKAEGNGKVLISSNSVSVETEEKIVVDAEKNLLYVESKGTNYQLYLTPEDASELVKGKGYEPAQGAELVVENNMPMYKLYAKKPVKFLWFTVGEEEVLLSVDQTGKMVEESTGG